MALITELTQQMKLAQLIWQPENEGPVAKQVLDMAQAGVVLDKAGCATVTPHMRRDDLSTT